MQQFKFTFSIPDNNVNDILIAALSEIGFDGFEETHHELTGFINTNNIDDDALQLIAEKYDVHFSKAIIEQQNWNAVWEANFQPVIIHNAVAVRAHFHQPIKTVQHEIIITPKMSFGTGHHATTSMMVEQMLQLDLQNKTVLDFGTGTGLLAILAEKLGAQLITAIDNDEWSIENAAENMQQNNCSRITLLFADKPPETVFDVLLANINKNIIVENFELLVNCLQQHSVLILSGLLIEDETQIVEIALKNNLHYLNTLITEKWICLCFILNL